uniref:SRS domain-containing protein n=1 Tax=Neospora caninum (strain Liverpool) TaxID=572307 RepID=F0JB58_NEOCL|nr:SRS domain-containing protein [Neospora caninum Liverpool]CEL71325.1 TPA: SRS domain-containing protein [Neospora caninum Liverpool]
MAGIRLVPSNRRMTGALFLVAVVHMSTAALGINATEQEQSANICTAPAEDNGQSTGISTAVDEDSKQVSFVCDSGVANVWPAATTNKVSQSYNDNTLTEKNNLAELFGEGSEASVTSPTADSPAQKTVTLSLSKLPETTQIVYFAAPRRCQARPSAPIATSRCHRFQFASTIIYALLPSLQQSPDLHLTPWWSSFLPAACTVQKQNMELEITSENKSVSFQCDTGISTLNPKESTTNIFDESCENEVTLAEKLPSASLTTTNSGYTFSVEELPETAITLCYKCSSPADDTEESPPERKIVACTVKINVAAANINSDSAAFATAGSASVLVLGLGISVFFATVSFKELCPAL